MNFKNALARTLMIVLICLSVGCGHKAPPVPPQDKKPPAPAPSAKPPEADTRPPVK